MTTNTFSRSVPRLRFPDFRNRPGWAWTTLSSVLEEHGLKSDGRSEVHSVSLAKGIVPQVEHMGRSFAASDTKHYSRVRPFDVVYTRSPLAIYRLGIVKQHKGADNAIVSPLYGVFAPKNPHLGQLIEAYFDDPSRSIRFLEPLAQKGAKNTIQLSNDRFLSGSLFLPEDEGEQQKIADCLGSLDGLIAAEGRKLDALRRHKQGLMQQIFPEINQAIPRLRFSGPAPSEGWASMRLSQVLVEHKLKTEGTCEVCSVSVHKGLVNQVEHLGRSYAASDTSKYNLVRPNDVVYTKSPTGAFPFGIVKKSQLECSAAVSPLYGVFSPINDHVGDVIEAYFDSPSRASAYLAPISHKGAKNTIQISNGTFLSGSIMLPKDIEEQRCIAVCLSGLKTMIFAHEAKIGALRRFKQGLMQQLFPSPDGTEP